MARSFVPRTVRPLASDDRVVAIGAGPAGIAQRFAVSADTVTHHLTNIFDKCGVSSRLELALSRSITASSTTSEQRL